MPNTRPFPAPNVVDPDSASEERAQSGKIFRPVEVVVHARIVDVRREQRLGARAKLAQRRVGIGRSPSGDQGSADDRLTLG